MGERLLGGRYRLEGTIGAGGMAEVHRGTDTVLGRPVAIKVLAPQFARDAAFVERFRREARAAARLNHPNVVNVYDTGSDDGTHYIVMEYVDGRTLADRLASGGALPTAAALELAGAVCRALSAAHRQGIVHRDIKPGNVMVTPEGQVKVMDFGIARLADGAETVAQTAAVLGTASYLSPEQARGEPVDERSDIYSLGVVLYEMLTGRPPFTGDSAVAVAYKHVQEAPEPPSRWNPDIPPALDAVVLRCLAKDPANRYPSAEQLRRDLERVGRGEPVEAATLLPEQPTVALRPGGPPTAQLPPEEPERPGRNVVGLVVAALAVTALLGGGLYLLVRALIGQQEPPPVPQVEVPRVLGFSEIQARSILENAGLHVGVVKRRFDEAPAGEVIAQDPAPPATVPEGTLVDLVVSRGPRPVEVPDLTGSTPAEAQAALEEVGLTLGLQTEQAVEPGAAEPGEIIDQFPAPGQKVQPGTAVNVVVAVAPPTPTTVIVPDLVCKSQGKAESDLGKLGLLVAYGEPQFNPTCPRPGKVAAMQPEPGTSVLPGSQVVLFPSTEAPATSPPPEGG